MKFVLNITMGNDAMRVRQDLALALESVKTRLLSSSVSEGKIMDLNGNSVGKWEFVEEKEKKYNAVVKRNGHVIILGEAKEIGKALTVKLDCFPTDGCFVLKEQE